MKGKTPGTGMIFNEKVKEDLKKLPKAAVPKLPMVGPITGTELTALVTVLVTL